MEEKEKRIDVGERFWINAGILMKYYMKPSMSLKTLAEKTGINYNTLRTYRMRKTAMRLDHAYLIADALNTSLDVMVHELPSFWTSGVALKNVKKGIFPTEEEMDLIKAIRSGEHKGYEEKIKFLTAIMPALDKFYRNMFLASDSDFNRFPVYRRFNEMVDKYKLSQNDLCNILEDCLEKRKGNK